MTDDTPGVRAWSRRCAEPTIPVRPHQLGRTAHSLILISPVAQRADHLPPRNRPVPGPPVGNRPPAARRVKVLDFGNVVAAPSCQPHVEELGAEVTLSCRRTRRSTRRRSGRMVARNGAGQEVDHRRHPDLEGRHGGVPAPRRQSDWSRATRWTINSLGWGSTRSSGSPEPLGDPDAVTAMYRAKGAVPAHAKRGYDPSAQAVVGITIRFGGPDAPSYNGVASAVDYLCGYLGAFATATALYARENEWRRAGRLGTDVALRGCNADTALVSEARARTPGERSRPECNGAHARATLVQGRGRMDLRPRGRGHLGRSRRKDCCRGAGRACGQGDRGRSGP